MASIVYICTKWILITAYWTQGSWNRYQRWKTWIMNICDIIVTKNG
uniref:ALE2 n=1 Tax=Arundo donax TaxID=35708 RepID=A0A0A9DFB7_ARUDO